MRSRLLMACALALALGGCGGGGGSNGGNTNGGGGAVTSGFFIGQTQAGETISLAVDSIHAVFFNCRGETEYQLFDPPQPISNDGSFFITMQSNGKTFVISGVITNDDSITGMIGGRSDCTGGFTVQRCDPNTQNCGDQDLDLIPDGIDPDGGTGPTPQRTPTPVASAASATPTASRVSTPLPSPSPVGRCGNGVLEGDEQCDGSLVNSDDCFADNGVCTCDDFCLDAEGTLSCNADCTFNFSRCASGVDGCSF